MNVEDLKALLKFCGCQDWEIEDEFERNSPKYLADLVSAKDKDTLVRVVGWDVNFVDEVLDHV